MTSAGLTAVPVGYQKGRSGSSAVDHAVDGDGASMCGQVASCDLTVVAGMSWFDMPEVAACRLCQISLPEYRKHLLSE